MPQLRTTLRGYPAPKCGLTEAFNAVQLLPLLSPGVDPRSTLQCTPCMLISSCCFPGNPTCGRNRRHKGKQATVWPFRLTRQSRIYNFNNGKQLRTGEAQSAMKPTRREAGLRGVLSLQVQEPLEALQPGCEPSLLACWDFHRFQHPVCMFRLKQSRELMMLAKALFGLHLWVGQTQA